MKKFEIGDKVKCIRPKSLVSNEYDLSKYEIYIIEKLAYDDYVYLKGIDDKNFNPDRFKKLKCDEKNCNIR